MVNKAEERREKAEKLLKESTMKVGEIIGGGNDPTSR